MDVVRIAKVAGAATGQDDCLRMRQGSNELGLNNVVGNNNEASLAQF